MILTGKHLNRRAFLRGAGACVALPFLDAMVPARAAAAPPVNAPVRLGFFYFPNGLVMEQYTPLAEGAGFEFTRILKPLEAFRENLLVLSGFAQANGRALGDGPGDHARAGATFLTGVHPRKTQGGNTRAGVSADQIAARQFGRFTQLPSFELGLDPPDLAGSCDAAYSCTYLNTLSWRTSTTPMPIETDPRAAFGRLFGDGENTEPSVRLAALERRRSLLDFVREDAARLASGLGPEDRNKLGEYLDAVRDIELRIQRAEVQRNDDRLPLLERPSGIPREFEDHAKLMLDLQVVAFQTDLTRVATFMLGRESSTRSYPSIGVPDAHHPLSHHGNDPAKIEKVAKINVLHMQQLAYLLGKLKATNDGDGSLLDHSILLCGSGLSDGNRHLHDNLPIILAGGSGRMRGGRHVRYPRETPLNNLLLTVLDRAGVPTEPFGDGTGEVTELG
jgi:hypothetical protein